MFHVPQPQVPVPQGLAKDPLGLQTIVPCPSDSFSTFHTPKVLPVQMVPEFLTTHTFTVTPLAFGHLPFCLYCPLLR